MPTVQPRPMLLSARASAATLRRTEAVAVAVGTEPPVATSGDLRRMAVVARQNVPTGRPTTAADAALALLAKIAEHITADDASSYLSFPAAALGADQPDSFGFIFNTGLVPPHSVIWRPPADHALLWDVWRSILDDAEVVDPELTAEERAKLEASRSLIFGDTTSETPSPVYERYRELLDAYLDAAAAAHDGDRANGPGTTGDDPAGIARASAVDAALRQLTVDGRRAEVEDALDTIARFGLTRPSTMWHDAREAMEVVTTWRTDVSGVEHPETTFLPPTFDAATWTPIELDAGEIENLADTARARFPELAESRLFDDTFDDEGGTLRVTSVRAEIAQYQVVRSSWFRPDLLAGRSWALRDRDAPPVSDGGHPATGRLKAFVSSVAVVRNVHVQRARVVTREHRRPAAPTSAASRTTALARVTARLSVIGTRIRDHRTRPASAPTRPVRPPPRVGRPAGNRPSNPAPVAPVRQDAPRIAAFVCQPVPRCPDPDLTLYPQLAKEQTT